MKVEQIKNVAFVFLACTAGAAALQIVFPIVLGIVVSMLPFAGVFLIYDLLIRKKLRIRFEWESDAEETLQVDSAEQNDTVNASPNEEERCRVRQWYQERGQERLRHIIETQYAKGLYECWIRKDGICNIRTEKGYRRAGILPEYPGESAALVAEVMRQDGLNAVIQKQYLYLSWAEE